MRSNHTSYLFNPPQRPTAPGSPCLEMIVQESPTNVRSGSYDLEQVELWLVTHEDLPEMATLSHPWLHGNQQQICAGKIALQLKSTERVIAFTFGGDLQVQPQNDKTYFILTSPAPILRLGRFNQISTILADEVAILLAERRAEELPDLNAYTRRLVGKDPLVLYRACLKALREKYTDISHHESPSIVAFSSFISTEIDSLYAADLWPNRVPDLVDLT